MILANSGLGKSAIEGQAPFFCKTVDCNLVLKANQLRCQIYLIRGNPPKLKHFYGPSPKVFRLRR